MKIKLLPLLLLSLLFVGAADSAVQAQETRAAIFGTVTDQSGAIIQNATVTAIQQDTNLKFTATTNDEGNFRFPLLPVGNYKLQVSFTDFEPFILDNIDLRVGEERRIDATLNVVSPQAVVLDVFAPLVTETAMATLQTVIPAERVENLPLNGRQLQELALTAPGVVASGGFRSSAFNQFGLATPSDGNAGAFSVNGAGSRSNGFFLDGVDINVPEQGVIAFPPLVESIREFQIQTNNFSAEFGRYSGAIVNFVTKSGTNDVRGNIYEFFRNDKLDANDPFNKAANLPRSVLRLNQFGGTLGAPVVKDRFFLFGNYEGNRIRQGTGAFRNNVPTAAQRSGAINFTDYTDLNGNNRFDAGEPTFAATTNVNVNPITRRILEGFIPLPNTTTIGANYIAEGINALDEDAFTIRGDARFSDKDLLTARYSYDNQRQFYPFDIFFVSASLPAFPFANPEKRQSAVVSYTRTLTDKFINEFRVGLNYQKNPIPSGTTVDPATINLPNGAPQNEFGRGLPVIRVTGFGGTGGQPLTDNLGASSTDRQVIQFIDNATLLLGDHNLRFGVELRRTRVVSNAFRPLRGALNFNGSRNRNPANANRALIDPNVPGNAAVAALADFLLGLPAQATISSADPNRIFQTKTFNGFVQDEWRVNQRLNLSLGLRYEIDTPLEELGGRVGNLIPGVGNFVVGSPELPRLHRLDKNNFAPRFGAAYSLTEDGKIVVRGGGGIFYDNGVFQDRFGTARTNAPFAISATDNNPAPFPTVGNAVTLTRLIGAGVPSSSAAAIAVDWDTPHAIQWNLNVQRELFDNTLAEIAYVGRRGINLSRQVNINQIVAANSIQAGVAPIGSRPFNNPNLPAGAVFRSDVVQQQTTASSIYHALQAKLERRLSRGTSFLAAYTFSKSLDDASGIGTGVDDRPQDSYNLRAQRAVSNFDVPHRFVFSATYALPFGKNQRFLNDAPRFIRALVSDFQINPITTLQSGQPFTVTIGAFDAITGISNRRPNLVGDPNENVPQGFAFNPAAFVAPPAGQLGNAGRNIVRGGEYFNTDLSVVRDFRLQFLGENRRLQFRAEFFNIFNTANFTAPVTTLASPVFGQFVSNAASPRVVQFAAKFYF